MQNANNTAQNNTLKNNILKSILHAFAVSLFVFLILSVSSYFLPATWDEGEMSFRAVESQNWVGTVNAEGHPQLAVILASLGRFIFPQMLSLGSLRFGSILLFSFACGICFYRVKHVFGITAAVFFIPSILLIPRLFAHCQIAAWDSTLISCWMLTWAVFPRNFLTQAPAARLYRLQYILFGICLGLTLSCKFSGWAVFIPYFIFIFFFVEKKHTRIIFLSIATALAVFYVLNPPLWTQPVSGLIDFFNLNLRRGGHYNVAILFFGTMYDLNHPLPWYNTAAWLGITVPAGILILSVTGVIISFSKGYRKEGLLLLLNFLTLPVIRSFPGTPVHDGVRMFVSCFPFLAVFAAIGAAFLWNRKELFNGMLLQRFAVIAVFAVSTLNMYAYAPQYLSFYNVFIGGLPGAVQEGMEAAYYWDSFDGEVIHWLNEHTEPDEKVAFSASSAKSILLNRNSCWDKNKKFFSFEPVVISPQTTLEELKHSGIRYYVLQRRPSGEFERDKQIITQADISVKCVFRKQNNAGGVCCGCSLPVPLLEIYQLRQ